MIIESLGAGRYITYSFGENIEIFTSVWFQFSLMSIFIVINDVCFFLPKRAFTFYSGCAFNSQIIPLMSPSDKQSDSKKKKNEKTHLVYSFCPHIYRGTKNIFVIFKNYDC